MGEEFMSRILVVDDEPRIRELHRQILSRDGHHVSMASNGIEGLLAMEMSLPDLILLDMAMPEMDGVEFLKVLRATPEWKKIPVLLMTAFSTVEQLSFVEALGVDQTLTKAEFSVKELRARIAAALPTKLPAAA
jgi:two-component system sensor histidine kinase/response regulator